MDIRELPIKSVWRDRIGLSYYLRSYHDLPVYRLNRAALIYSCYKLYKQCNSTVNIAEWRDQDRQFSCMYMANPRHNTYDTLLCELICVHARDSLAFTTSGVDMQVYRISTVVHPSVRQSVRPPSKSF
jgi:hypothetical protein